VFAAVAREMMRRGAQVTFVPSPESSVEQRVAYDGYEVMPVDGGGPWMAESWRLRQVMLDRFVEVVFVHTEREHEVAAAATRWAERGAVVRRTPAGAPLIVTRRSRLAMRLAATNFVFTTQSELQSAPTLKRAPEAVVADIGVDAATYDEVRPASRQSLGVAATGGHLIVCVYDPRAKARAALVMRTVALLAPRHPELRLALVGPGSDHEDLRMHAAALGLTNVVAHLGERDDQLAVLRCADIGWVVADGDDAAYGVLDLMALRLPVLAERGSVAQRYVADGITGILLPPGDVPATAAIVASFLAHGDQRAAMGNAARVRVARDFAESSMVDRFERAAELARDRTKWIL
jgi:hypothetical protein